MWEIDNSFQFVSFLISVGVGVIYSVLYDILRAIRKNGRTSDITVFFQDLFYFLIIAILTFLLLMSLSFGEIRGYIIIGLVLGFAIGFLTLSKITVIIFAFVFKWASKIGDKFIASINLFFDKVGEFILKTVKKIIQLLKNTKKIFKKHLKKTG